MILDCMQNVYHDGCPLYDETIKSRTVQYGWGGREFPRRWGYSQNSLGKQPLLKNQNKNQMKVLIPCCHVIKKCWAQRVFFFFFSRQTQGGFKGYFMSLFDVYFFYFENFVDAFLHN